MEQKNRWFDSGFAKGLLGALAVVTLIGMGPPMLAGTMKFWDSTNGKPRTVSDKYPMPVRFGLTWQSGINVTLQNCTSGGIPLNEVDNPTVCLTDDGGSFVNDTTDCTDAGTNDVAPFPDPAAIGDAFYIGNIGTIDNRKIYGKFNAVNITIGTSGNTSLTVAWQYWDGDSWEPLTFVRQDLVDFDEAAAADYWNTFKPPTDWQNTVVNGTRAYYIRVRVATFSSTTTQALVTQLWVTSLDTDLANQVVCRADTDETEDVWCKPIGDVDGTDVGLDNGFVFDAGTGSKTWETDRSSGEYICCGDGGAVNFMCSNHYNGQ